MNLGLLLVLCYPLFNLKAVFLFLKLENLPYLNDAHYLIYSKPIVIMDSLKGNGDK